MAQARTGLHRRSPLVPRFSGQGGAPKVQGIKVKWRELGWDALIGEFAPRGIGAELVEVEV